MAAPVVKNQGIPGFRVRASGENENEERVVGAYAWASARLALGFIFLWAFFDKLLGWTYSTKTANAWINGGNPTNGYLAGTKGWFQGFFHAIAGTTLTNWLFMGGLLLLGAALVLGIGVRIAGYAGALMMLLMYAAGTLGVPGTTNPVVDDHIVYAIVLLGMTVTHAGRKLGFGSYWSRLAVVQKYPILE